MDRVPEVFLESKSSHVGRALKQFFHPREYGDSCKSESRYMYKVIKTTRPSEVRAFVSLYCQPVHQKIYDGIDCLFLTVAELMLDKDKNLKQAQLWQSALFKQLHGAE